MAKHVDPKLLNAAIKDNFKNLRDADVEAITQLGRGESINVRCGRVNGFRVKLRYLRKSNGELEASMAVIYNVALKDLK